MKLVDFRHVGRRSGDAERSLVEHALAATPLNGIVLDAFREHPFRTTENRDRVCTRSMARDRMIWAVPCAWQVAVPRDFGRQVGCTGTICIDSDLLRGSPEDSWLVISNGRFVAHANGALVERALAGVAADAVAVMVDPYLAAYGERVRLTPNGDLVGYRRLYRDSLESALVPRDWPHHLFVRGDAVGVVWDGGLPSEFRTVVERLRSRRLELKAIAVAGSLVDLEKKEDLLSLCHRVLDGASSASTPVSVVSKRCTGSSDSNRRTSPQARFIGPVWLGNDVCVESDAIIVGPSVLCDNSAVRAGAVVDGSIVGIGGEVARDEVVRNTVVIARPGSADRSVVGDRTDHRAAHVLSQERIAFRSWPRLSYAACFKRIADIVAAAVVLILFAPIIPFIALAVKISSPGPVFFGHRRQGLHGRPFRCIKFRTMRAGADKLQDTLRFISEVDGPQFKMADDPRITTVGRFLRETYLDEIPQFFNVLRGDMSVVGPRPSPEAENTLCPWWRDARLSVRPGITGLWQICRTRRPMRDFQEWIHYDTKYVHELSLRLDLWICRRTFGKMVVNFLKQF